MPIFSPHVFFLRIVAATLLANNDERRLSECDNNLLGITLFRHTWQGRTDVPQ
jgi:hypothetical protein